MEFEYVTLLTLHPQLIVKNMLSDNRSKFINNQN